MNDVHVIPNNDLKEHQEKESCWCNPKIEIKPNGNKVIIHNSADMREYVKENKNKVKN